MSVTFTFDDWKVDPCRECGGSHGQLTRGQYEAAYDEMAHPWKHVDRPRVAREWHLFPRCRRIMAAVQETRARLLGAWTALRHGVEEDW